MVWYGFAERKKEEEKAARPTSPPATRERKGGEDELTKKGQRSGTPTVGKNSKSAVGKNRPSPLRWSRIGERGKSRSVRYLLEEGAVR